MEERLRESWLLNVHGITVQQLFLISKKRRREEKEGKEKKKRTKKVLI
jgi:hypothetical protein